MLLLNIKARKFVPGVDYISIYLMLLLNLRLNEYIPYSEENFNTSHVTVKRY